MREGETAYGNERNTRINSVITLKKKERRGKEEKIKGIKRNYGACRASVCACACVRVSTLCMRMCVQ